MVNYDVGDIVTRRPGTGGNGVNSRTTFRIEEGDEAVVMPFGGSGITLKNAEGKICSGNSSGNLVFVRKVQKEWD